MAVLTNFVIIFLLQFAIPIFVNGSNGVVRKTRQFQVCREGQCHALKSFPSADYLSKLLFSFGGWGAWSPCNKDCSTFRSRICRFPFLCGSTTVYEEAFCFHRGSRCEYVFKNHQKHLNPYASGTQDYYAANEESAENVANTASDGRRQSESKDHYRDSNSNRPNSPNPQSKQEGKGEQSSGGTELRVNGLTGETATCGVARMTDKNRPGLTMRILGGKETQKGRWPWQVAILNRVGETFCGGTLISPRWIITAAHCVRRRITITIGEHHLHTIEGTERHFRIETAFIHPNFDPETVDNDIALLLLPEPVSTEAGVACLPANEQPLPASGTLCTILGWGKERYNHVFGTTTLHEGRVPLVSNADCRLTYDPSELTSNMFCSGYRNGTVDSCAGDSGGPLLCRRDNRWTLYGVTSFGDGCGRVGKYGIYAKVPNYVNWINKVISATEESLGF